MNSIGTIASPLTWGAWVFLASLSLAAQAEAKENPPSKIPAVLQLLYERQEALKFAGTYTLYRLYDDARTIFRATYPGQEGSERMLTDILAYRKSELGSKDDFLFEAAVLTFCRNEDRTQLKELLAVYCPKMIRIQNLIEFQLAVGSGEALSEPLLVLCDAYERSTSDENRKRIVAALERSANGFLEKNEEDDKFVQEFRQWYVANHKSLKANSSYTIRPFMFQREAKAGRAAIRGQVEYTRSLVAGF